MVSQKAIKESSSKAVRTSVKESIIKCTAVSAVSAENAELALFIHGPFKLSRSGKFMYVFCSKTPEKHRKYAQALHVEGSVIFADFFFPLERMTDKMVPIGLK